MVTHYGLVYLLKKVWSTLHGILTRTTLNYRSIALIWVITLGLFPQICVQHSKERNKQHNKLYASAAHQAHLVSPWIIWLDYASYMLRPNEPDMPPKHTKMVPLGIYRTQIRPSEHDIVVISGQWYDITGYQDTWAVDTASGSAAPRI